MLIAQVNIPLFSYLPLANISAVATIVAATTNTKGAPAKNATNPIPVRATKPNATIATPNTNRLNPTPSVHFQSG